MPVTEDIKDSIKEHLKNLRKEKGYVNGRDFCIALGLSYSTYSNYEAGIRIPPLDLLIQLADFYGVTIDYIVGHKTASQTDDIISNLSDREWDLIRMLVSLPAAEQDSAYKYVSFLHSNLPENPDS